MVDSKGFNNVTFDRVVNQLTTDRWLSPQDIVRVGGIKTTVASVRSILQRLEYLSGFKLEVVKTMKGYEEEDVFRITLCQKEDVSVGGGIPTLTPPSAPSAETKPKEEVVGD